MSHIFVLYIVRWMMENTRKVMSHLPKYTMQYIVKYNILYIFLFGLLDEMLDGKEITRNYQRYFLVIS